MLAMDEAVVPWVNAGPP